MGASIGQGNISSGRIIQALNMAGGHVLARCMHAAAKMRLADIIETLRRAGQPATAESIAAAYGGVDAEGVSKVLRLLRVNGYFVEHPATQEWANNADSMAAFGDDVKEPGLAQVIELLGAHIHWHGLATSFEHRLFEASVTRVEDRFAIGAPAEPDEDAIESYRAIIDAAAEEDDYELFSRLLSEPHIKSIMEYGPINAALAQAHQERRLKLPAIERIGPSASHMPIRAHHHGLRITSDVWAGRARDAAINDLVEMRGAGAVAPPPLLALAVTSVISYGPLEQQLRLPGDHAVRRKALQTLDVLTWASFGAGLETDGAYLKLLEESGWRPIAIWRTNRAGLRTLFLANPA